MKRKGFTLIELLAVIVVLAIIAVIATPMVLNTIEESRQGAAMASATISTDKYYSSNKINGELYKYANICDATFGVTSWFVSTAGTYPNGDSTCKKYSTVYQNGYVDYGVLGYRPVITVKEK